MVVALLLKQNFVPCVNTYCYKTIVRVSVPQVAYDSGPFSTPR